MWAQGLLEGGIPGAGMECGVMPPSALFRFDRLPLMLLLSGLCRTGFSSVLVSVRDVRQAQLYFIICWTAANNPSQDMLRQSKV